MARSKTTSPPKKRPAGERKAASALRPKSGAKQPAMRQFNGMDSLFLYMDGPHAGMHGAFLQIYAPVRGEDEVTRYQRLLRHIERRLDASPVFRRAIVRSPLDLDHAYWVDGVAVDLHYHVRHSALPKPGTAAQLNDAYAKIYAQPMDMERPLWEIHVIDGVNAVEGVPKGSFALVVKFHHAGADGVSATEITSVLHSTSPVRSRSAPRPAKAVPLPPPPSIDVALRRSAKLYARFGTALGKELTSRLPALSRSLTRWVMPGAEKESASSKPSRGVPRTLINVAVSTDRSYTHIALGLDDIKRIREKLEGATVNDVFLTVVGGALRRFLQHYDGLPRQSLVAGVPVNVRKEDERGQAGNQFTLMMVPLRTDEPNAARRMMRITTESARAKATLQRGGARKSANWFKIVPAPLLSLFGSAVNRMRITARMAPLFNLIVTNVPGPRETLYLDGARLVEFNGAPPVMDGLGIIIGASSYENALRIGIAACRKVMPEPELMRQYLLESFDELKRETSKAAPPKKQPAKRSVVAKPAIAKKTATAKTAPRKKAAIKKSVAPQPEKTPRGQSRRIRKTA